MDTLYSSKPSKNRTLTRSLTRLLSYNDLAASAIDADSVKLQNGANSVKLLALLKSSSDALAGRLLGRLSEEGYYEVIDNSEFSLSSSGKTATVEGIVYTVSLPAIVGIPFFDRIAVEITTPAAGGGVLLVAEDMPTPRK